MDLVQGFEIPFGIEALSTVHWVVTREGADDLDQVIEMTRAWSPRKKMFKRGQIRTAWNILGKKDWLSGDQPRPADLCPE